MVIISAIVCIYYNIIITWTMYYLFNSFYRVLPWSTCDNEWNTEHCVSHHDLPIATDLNETLTYTNASQGRQLVHAMKTCAALWRRVCAYGKNDLCLIGKHNSSAPVLCTSIFRVFCAKSTPAATHRFHSKRTYCTVPF